MTNMIFSNYSINIPMQINMKNDMMNIQKRSIFSILVLSLIKKSDANLFQIFILRITLLCDFNFARLASIAGRITPSNISKLLPSHF